MANIGCLYSEPAGRAGIYHFSDTSILFAVKYAKLPLNRIDLNGAIRMCDCERLFRDSVRFLTQTRS